MDGPGGQGLPVRLTHARHEDKSEHRTWDFLQGEGPSSVQMYYAEEKKAFKPGWKSLRPQQVIRQQEQRLQQEEVKVCSDPLSCEQGPPMHPHMLGRKVRTPAG
ncbi:MAG: hypothetical protein WDW36_010232 [Sanguina aurantia]